MTLMMKYIYITDLLTNEDVLSFIKYLNNPTLNVNSAY